jgi:hypothetical protein
MTDWPTYIERVRTHIDTMRTAAHRIRCASQSIGFRYPWSIFPVDRDLTEIRDELRKLADDVDDTIKAIERSKEIKAYADAANR